MIERWNSEIDTYLVYAGLFSAIVTAFNVQSYLPLQQQPDLTLAAVMQISLQLNSLSINPPFVNSTHPAFGSSDAAHAGPAPGPAAGIAIVALNTLWFSSLVLSLSSASIGIMVKQWLNEYKSGLSSGSQKTARDSQETRETRESTRLRQYRLDNLIKWRVDIVVLAIPVLLQLALAFFLAGLLVLAWTLHHTVAAITTVFIALLAIFTLATMLLPSVKSSCAYLSPQALVLDTVSQTMRYIFCRTLYGLAFTIWDWADGCLTHDDVALRQPLHLVGRITGIVKLWCRGSRNGPDRTVPPRSWRTREKEVIAQSRNSLDSDLFVMAYDTSLADPNILDAAAKCLTDVDKMTVIRMFSRLHAVAAGHLNQVRIPIQVAHHVMDSAKLSSFVLWWNTLLSLLATPPSIFTESPNLYLSALTELNVYWTLGITVNYFTNSPDWQLGVLSAAMWNVDSERSCTGNSARLPVLEELVSVAWIQLEMNGQLSCKAIGYCE
ncbi:hypothetical protein BV20DRAFT_958459 [Pilatotrama ljubarskyi]|nr:hypothetical protein BV20DRAFT_958459 [Pilatotrama ljubarskyi]